MNKTELDLIKKHEKELWKVRCESESCGKVIDKKLLNTQIQELEKSKKALHYYAQRAQNRSEMDEMILKTAFEKAHEAMFETIREMTGDTYYDEIMHKDYSFYIGKIGVDMLDSFGLWQNSWDGRLRRSNCGSISDTVFKNKVSGVGVYKDEGEAIYSNFTLEGELDIRFKYLEERFLNQIKRSDDKLDEKVQKSYNAATERVRNCETKVIACKENIEREKSIQDYFETTRNEQEIAPEMSK